MQGIGAERRAHQHNALKPLGVNADLARTMSAQVGATGLEAEILALPVWTGDQVVLQSGGTLKFMWGLSAFGGDDEF